jgi:hypothetical protein
MNHLKEMVEECTSKEHYLCYGCTEVIILLTPGYDDAVFCPYCGTKTLTRIENYLDEQEFVVDVTLAHLYSDIEFIKTYRVVTCKPDEAKDLAKTAARFDYERHGFAVQHIGEARKV